MTEDFLQILELKSFFNIWYWLFLAFIWSRATYFTLGVPLHDARLGHEREGVYMHDFEELMRINTGHTVEAFDQYGVAVMAVIAFLLASAATLGFGFRMEIMQAIFLLMAPLTGATLFSVRFAYRIQAEKITGQSLYTAYVVHRRIKQIFGMLSMIVTSVWAGIRIFYFS
ncbi:hypothetical protein GCM10008927_02350 [Amylibacter ulvae]|uniref:Component of SufBCD complex n=2 Tax=Paramylibacter TaxID=3143987 RepID=A0A2G5K7C6_9RHOB|nr:MULTISPECIES: hypothetical protein [Amylibacter]PIB24760.1 hypothetical protein BFP76_06170 [Amylibacter kogurei]GHA41525.1 hypothetical protein GCM10008927_02350 [Amylibacter ulvae]